MKGQTISITLPIVVVESYDRKALRLGISRSKAISNVLIPLYERERDQKPPNQPSRAKRKLLKIKKIK